MLLGGLVVEAIVLMIVAQRGVASLGHQLLTVVVVRVAVLVVATVLRLAAANGEDPEQVGTKCEGGTDPDNSEEVGVEVGMDAIELCGRLHGANNNRGKGSGHTTGNENKQGGE